MSLNILGMLSPRCLVIWGMPCGTSRTWTGPTMGKSDQGERQDETNIKDGINIQRSLNGALD